MDEIKIFNKIIHLNIENNLELINIIIIIIIGINFWRLLKIKIISRFPSLKISIIHPENGNIPLFKRKNNKKKALKGSNGNPLSLPPILWLQRLKFSWNNSIDIIKPREEILCRRKNLKEASIACLFPEEIKKGTVPQVVISKQTHHNNGLWSLIIINIITPIKMKRNEKKWTLKKIIIKN